MDQNKWLKIPHLFKRDEQGLAIAELSDEKYKWVTDGRGWASYKLVGIPARLITVEGGSLNCQVWDEEKGYWRFYSAEKDPAVKVAFFELPQRLLQEGQFVVYGKDVRGNPHGAEGTYMTRTSPVSNLLMIPSHTVRLRPYTATTVKELYDTLKKELLEARTNVPGVVFHSEVNGQTQDMVQVTMEDFGRKFEGVQGKLDDIPLKPTVVPASDLPDPWDLHGIYH